MLYANYSDIIIDTKQIGKGKIVPESDDVI